MCTKKTCLECDYPIIGRKDKKFCSDSCRSAFHNQLRGPAENQIRKTNIILRKNRRILFDFYNNKSATIERNKLLEAGFKFPFSTQIEINEAGTIKKYCYDISYMQITDLYYKITMMEK